MDKKLEKYDGQCFLLFQIKSLRKIGGVDYKDHARQILYMLFTNDIMAKMNLKGNENKIGVVNTEIWRVIMSK